MPKLIKGSPWLETGAREVTVKDAIESSINYSSYLSDGQLESVQDKCAAQAEIIATLIQLLVDANLLTLEQIKPMLGYDYTVEE